MGLDTDDGSIFLDFDPDCFETILHQLRLAQLSGKKPKWIQVKAPEGKLKYFKELLKFFALVRQNDFIASVDQLHPHLIVLEDGSKVKHNDRDGHAFALGTMVLEHGIHTWMIKM